MMLDESIKRYLETRYGEQFLSDVLVEYGESGLHIEALSFRRLINGSFTIKVELLIDEELFKKSEAA